MSIEETTIRDRDELRAVLRDLLDDATSLLLGAIREGKPGFDGPEAQELVHAVARQRMEVARWAAQDRE